MNDKIDKIEEEARMTLEYEEALRRLEGLVRQVAEALKEFKEVRARASALQVFIEELLENVDIDVTTAVASLELVKFSMMYRAHKMASVMAKLARGLFEELRKYK